MTLRFEYIYRQREVQESFVLNDVFTQGFEDILTHFFLFVDGRGVLADDAPRELPIPLRKQEVLDDEIFGGLRREGLEGIAVAVIGVLLEGLKLSLDGNVD